MQQYLRRITDHDQLEFSVRNASVLYLKINVIHHINN